MDSRAEGIYDSIHKQPQPEYIGVWKQQGATLGDLVDLASAHLRNSPFDIVYIAGGVNNITTKNRATGKISFLWDPPETIIPHLASDLRAANDQLTKEFPASKVIFCSLVGSDLARVVNAHKTTWLQQESVNEAVFTFNEEVFRINKWRGTVSPSLHRTVHRSKNGKHKSYYDHLWDGIHLHKNLKK